MIRAAASWAVVGGLAALVAAAAVDALRPRGSPPPSPKTTTAQERSVAGAVETAPDRCATQQLALRVENLGGGPALALVHFWGPPCRTPRLPINVALFDRTGRPVGATVGIQSAFAPTTLSPSVEVIAGFNFVYLCGQRRPVRVVAEAGPYPATGRLPRGVTACLDDLGP